MSEFQTGVRGELARLRGREAVLVAEVRRLRGALEEANRVLRSAHAVADRHSRGAPAENTNWESYLNRLDVVLQAQHEILFARAALDHHDNPPA